MSFGLGGGGTGGGGAGGKGAYKDLEHAPLSADTEGMMSLPSYLDNPVKTAAASPVDKRLPRQSNRQEGGE